MYREIEETPPPPRESHSRSIVEFDLSFEILIEIKFKSKIEFIHDLNKSKQL